MEPAPLYRGESVSIPANATPVAPLNNPFSELLAVGRKYGLEATEQLSDFLIDNYESALENKRAEFVSQVEREARLGLIERMQLNDGDSRGFYDRYGIYQPAKAQAFISSFTAKLSGLDQGFIRPHSVENARKANNAATGSLELLLASTIMGSMKDRARSSFKRRFNNMMESGQYAEAEASLADENVINNFDQPDIDSFRIQATQAQQDANIGNAIVNGDSQSLLAMMDNADISLTPAQRQRISNGLDEIQDARMRNSLQGSYTRSTSDGKTPEDKWVDAYRNLRPGTPKPVLDLIDKYQGAIKENGTALQEAEQLAARQVASMVTSANDEAAAINFKNTFRELGVNEDYLTRLANARLKSLAAVSNFNPDEAAKHLDDSIFVSAETMGAYNDIRNQMFAADKNGDEEEIKELAPKVKQQQLAIEAARKNILEAVAGEYTVWLAEYKDSTPDDKESPVECGSQYMSILNKHLAAHQKSVENYQSPYSKELAINWNRLQEDRKKGQEESAAGDAALKERMPEIEKRIQQAQKEQEDKLGVHAPSFILNSTTADFVHGKSVPSEIALREDYKGKEAIVYYPSDKAPESGEVSIWYDRNKLVRAKVVKVDGIQAPVFSQGACQAVHLNPTKLNNYNAIAWHADKIHLFWLTGGDLFPAEVADSADAQTNQDIADEGIDLQGAADAADAEEAEPMSDYTDAYGNLTKDFPEQ